LQLLPRILDGQNLLIHFSVDVSDEPEDLTLASGLAVSLYKQNVRNFMQRVSLRSGETLVLSGYEKNTSTAYKSGVESPDNPLAGGGRDALNNRDIIVIMITPVIMDRVRS
jgi:type II secretory pathway component GspD/PulD (secretin)